MSRPDIPSKLTGDEWQGLTLKTLLNAVLALYGDPEPRPQTGLDEILARLNELAAERRAETSA